MYVKRKCITICTYQLLTVKAVFTTHFFAILFQNIGSKKRCYRFLEVIISSLILTKSKLFGVYFFDNFVYFNWIIIDRFNCSGNACFNTLTFIVLNNQCVWLCIQNNCQKMIHIVYCIIHFIVSENIFF